MTTQDVRPATDEGLTRAVARLQYALGCEPDEAEAFLLRDPERRERIARFVRRDEADNAAFYRELGNR